MADDTVKDWSLVTPASTNVVVGPAALATAGDSEDARIDFPEPASLDGIKSSGKAVLRMHGIGFHYPGSTRAAVADVTLTLSQASRVAVTGSTGAGKTTLLELLAGKKRPTNGSLMQVKGLCVALLSQNSLCQLDEHLQQTPAQYIHQHGIGVTEDAKKHLTNLGLDEATSNTRMELLNESARAKLVLAAVMTKRPHILLLDGFVERLDDDDRVALTSAIKHYKGGVVIISQNCSFCEAIATEKWTMSNGSLNIQSLPSALLKPNSEKVKDKKMGSTQEEERKRIKAVEQKIKSAKIKPLTERELWDLDHELNSLKDILLNDVKLRDPASPEASDHPISGLGEVIDEQLRELLMEEFGADLKNFQRTQEEFGLKLSLLVQKRTEAALDAQELDLVGFLAYKTWGSPAPCVSIGAVGVAAKHRGKSYGRQLMKVAEDQASLLGTESPDGFIPGEVRLRSVATAVHFYERLGYERVEESLDEAKKTPGCPNLEVAAPAVEADDDEDEDAPCVPMVKRCTKLSPRTTAKMLPTLSPRPDAWSPRRSRALEDGPTWPAISLFMLPETAS